MARKLSITPETKGKRTWDHLEEFVRGHVQRFIKWSTSELYRDGLKQIANPSSSWQPDLWFALSRARQKYNRGYEVRR